MPACGIVYAGRAICSPLHAVVNVGFGVQGLFFVVAAIAISQALTSRMRWLLVAFAGLNGLGIATVGLVPETASAELFAGLPAHGLGALLAIVFGNTTVLLSVLTFSELRLPALHRAVSIVLPLTAAAALALLLDGWHGLPAGVLERSSVYTITAWELLSAAFLLAPTVRR